MLRRLHIDSTSAAILFMSEREHTLRHVRRHASIWIVRKDHNFLPEQGFIQSHSPLDGHRQDLAAWHFLATFDEPVDLVHNVFVVVKAVD